MKIFHIVVSEFNSMITDQMLELCLKTFSGLGFEAKVFKVPGAMEIPFVVQKNMIESRPSAVVVLGCVIRGETEHFKVICDTVPRALMELSLEHKIPIVNEILMVNAYQDAEKRIQKAAHAAEVALKMSEFTL